MSNADDFIMGQRLFNNRLKRNAVLCNKCGVVAESRHRHSTVSCKCGHVSVDGGLAYARRVYRGAPDWVELTEKDSEP